MRYKTLALPLSVLCASAIICMGCTETNARQNFLTKTSLKTMPDYKYVTTIETHGGVNGDGETFYVFSFKEQNGIALAEQLKYCDHWYPAPLDDTTAVLAYNNEDYNLNNFEIPPVLNGYYFFFDEQTESYVPPAGYLENSFSFNFRIAVYDSDNFNLYYYELDT